MTGKHIEIITTTLALRDTQVRNTIKMLDEGSTVPFISRYRKEATGSLDETQVLAIKEQYEKLIEVEKTPFLREKNAENSI